MPYCGDCLYDVVDKGDKVVAHSVGRSEEEFKRVFDKWRVQYNIEKKSLEYYEIYANETLVSEEDIIKDLEEIKYKAECKEHIRAAFNIWRKKHSVQEKYFRRYYTYVKNKFEMNAQTLYKEFDRIRVDFLDFSGENIGLGRVHDIFDRKRTKNDEFQILKKKFGAAVNKVNSEKYIDDLFEPLVFQFKEWLDRHHIPFHRYDTLLCELLEMKTSEKAIAKQIYPAAQIPQTQDDEETV